MKPQPFSYRLVKEAMKPLRWVLRDKASGRIIQHPNGATMTFMYKLDAVKYALAQRDASGGVTVDVEQEQ